MLKKLIIGAAFSALIASSAMAQSYQPMWGSGNIIPGPNGGFANVPYDAERFGGPYAGAYAEAPFAGPFAYEPPAVHHRYRHHTNRHRYND